MPSFDINAILSAALATVVAEAVAPLVERIATLETRLAALENNPAQGVEPPVVIDEAKMVAALDSQEWFWHKVAGFITNNSEITAKWFWHKVAGFVTNNSEITANDLEILKDRVGALESSRDASGLSKSAVEALIEQTMDHHLECYDHDNYDEIASKVDDIDFDDLVSKDDLSDAVRDAVQDLSFEIRVS